MIHCDGGNGIITTDFGTRRGGSPAFCVCAVPPYGCRGVGVTLHVAARIVGQRAAATLSNQASLAARASNDWQSMLIMVRIVFLILCARKASLLKNFHAQN
jgi:hypothetical protein